MLLTSESIQVAVEQGHGGQISPALEEELLLETNKKTFQNIYSWSSAVVFHTSNHSIWLTRYPYGHLKGRIVCLNYPVIGNHRRHYMCGHYMRTANEPMYYFMSVKFSSISVICARNILWWNIHVLTVRGLILILHLSISIDGHNSKLQNV